MSILIAIPAAGASRRMRGRDKLLEDVAGEPLLRRQTRAALATGHPVLVLLPPESPARANALEGLNASQVDVPDAADGMSASLRLAAEHASAYDGLAVLLPDVPGVGITEISAVLDAYFAHSMDNAKPPVVRASDPEGRPGTPIVFPPRLLPLFKGLSGDDGGRSLLQTEEVRRVVFPDNRATWDLDTPEDWAAYTAQNPTIF